MASVTLVPAGYDGQRSSYISVDASYPLSNGLTSSSSDTFAVLNLNKGGGAVSKLAVKFDVSNIPTHAKINSNSSKINDTGGGERESLDDLILRITCTRGSLSANNSHTLRFYGADLTVDYTGGGSSGPVLSTKVNGSWVNVSKVYKKVSGIWVEQSDIANLFSTDTNYVKG